MHQLLLVTLLENMLYDRVTLSLVLPRSVSYWDSIKNRC